MLKLEAILKHRDAMDLAMPMPDQPRARLERSGVLKFDLAFNLELHRHPIKLAQPFRCKASMDLLLQSPCNGTDQLGCSQALGKGSAAMQTTPLGA